MDCPNLERQTDNSPKHSSFSMIVDTEGANSKNVLDVGLLCEIPMPKWNGILFSSTSSMCSTLIKMHWPLSMEFSVLA